jgi:hypothetical protein
MTQDMKRLLDHYRRVGGAELDLFRSLYRCLVLEERARKNRDPK